MTRGIAILSVAATIGCLASAGCGSEGGGDETVILNTKTVEKAIQQAVLEQRNTEVNVDCPSGVHQQEGLTFECIAQGQGVRSTFTVTQTDNDGNVTFAAS